MPSLHASVNGAVCAIDATTGAITLVSPGTCSLTGTKATDANYLAATSALGTFTVKVTGHPSELASSVAGEP